MRWPLLIIVSLLHLPNVLVMIGWYSQIPIAAVTLGMFVGHYLQLLAFVVTAAAFLASPRVRRDIVLLVISIIGAIAFVHQLTHSPY